MQVKAEKNKISFILYEGSQAPKYFEISKSMLKFIVFGLPFITLIAISLLAAGGIYFKQIKTMAERKEPEIIQLLKLEKLALEKKEEDALKMNEELIAKLSSTTAPSVGLTGLNIFSATAGSLDKTQTPVFEIQEDEVLPAANKIHFRFNVVNLTKDNSKLAGYIFVLMKHQDSLHLYPKGSIPTDQFEVKYSKGESFATRRFRSTEAIFPKPKTSGVALFKVIIFSRSGDLLHKKIISKKINI